MLALKLWRCGMWCHRHHFKPGARVCKSLCFLLFGALLEPEVELRGHVNFAHRGLGVVIHGSTVLGDWVQIWQYATIASSDDKDEPWEHGVRVEDGAMIGAHAIIVCPRGRTLTIGRNAVIGAGAFVNDDVPAGAIVRATPSPVDKSRAAERAGAG